MIEIGPSGSFNILTDIGLMFYESSATEISYSDIFDDVGMQGGYFAYIDPLIVNGPRRTSNSFSVDIDNNEIFLHGDDTSNGQLKRRDNYFFVGLENDFSMPEIIYHSNGNNYRPN